jgi:hypothetical protein
VLSRDPDWRTLSADPVATVFVVNLAGSR